MEFSEEMYGGCASFILPCRDFHRLEQRLPSDLISFSSLRASKTIRLPRTTINGELSALVSALELSALVSALELSAIVPALELSDIVSAPVCVNDELYLYRTFIKN